VDRPRLPCRGPTGWTRPASRGLPPRA
jgi:hypothetical protein